MALAPGSHAVRVDPDAVRSTVAAPAGICAAHCENASPMAVVPSGVVPRIVLRRQVVPSRVNVTIESPPHVSAAAECDPGVQS